MGGGAVLDPLRGGPCCATWGEPHFSETLEKGNHKGNSGSDDGRALLGLGQEELVARTAWTERMSPSASRKALKPEWESRFDGTARLGLRKLFEEVGRKIVEKVEKFQKENPLLPGIAREELPASLVSVFDPKLFAPCLKI